MKKIILILIALTIVVLLIVAFWQKKHHGNEIVLFGNVDVRQADLGFRVYGRVKTLFVDEGDLVTPGQLMAELDPVPYVEKLVAAKARSDAIKKRLDNARIVYERRQKLIPTLAVSEENFTDSLAEVKILEGEFEAAKAEELLAGTNLEDTKMLCPSEGTILTRIREPGSVVNIGQPVFSLSVLSPVWVRCFVNEFNLGRIYPGMKAKIATDSGPKVFDGHIGFISPVAEFTPKTVETATLRTDLVYRIRVMVDNPDRLLKQGMPVTVTLEAASDERH